MNKLFLLLSLSLFAPVCQAMDNDHKSILKQPSDSQPSGRTRSAKRVRFAQEPQVRVFKKDVSEQKTPTAASKPSIPSRLGNGALGAVMVLASPFAIAKGIDLSSKNSVSFLSPNGLLGSMAVVGGLVILVAGVEKARTAIWIS